MNMLEIREIPRDVMDRNSFNSLVAVIAFSIIVLSAVLEVFSSCTDTHEALFGKNTSR